MKYEPEVSAGEFDGYIPFDLAELFQFGCAPNSALPMNPVTGQPVDLEEEEETKAPHGWGPPPWHHHPRGPWNHRHRH